MLPNNSDSNNRKENTFKKRINLFSLIYVSLFGFIFLSGSILSNPMFSQGYSAITSSSTTTTGIQDVYAQQAYYPPPQPKSYGNDYGYAPSYDKGQYDSNSYDSGNDYGKSYGNSYGNSYGYDYEKKNYAQIEKNDNKLFICDNGIVVDDRINCPQKCPFNTPLEGVYVMDLDVCNIQPGVGVTCPLDTDLPGVVVLNEANCNIFEICDASSTPLGQALGQDVKVADSALCQLSNVPNLQVCPPGSLFEGFAVNDADSCDLFEGVQVCGPTTDLPGVLTTDAATCNVFETCDLNTPLGASLGTDVDVVDADICQLKIATCDSDSGLANALGLTGTIMVTDEQLCELEVTSHTTTCPAGSDLAGVVVLEDQANVICNIEIPPTFTCPADSNLPGAIVTDERICNLNQVPLVECAAGTNNAGAVVTDERLCQAPNDQNKCPLNTDLANVYVMNPDTDCNIFESCVAGDPIFNALPAGSSEFQVVDDTICQLQVPEEIELIECQAGSILGAGALVTDEQLCNAATPAEQCPADSLAGIWVDPQDAETACNPEGVNTFTCPDDSQIPGAVVTDLELCKLSHRRKQRMSDYTVFTKC
ncbi:MAG: hypothetical protein MRJ93_14770 [Nitrososphaeraceae archaeon]|nr:hypothetical protein [Nitrososphaeraceae archaeon]